MNARVFTLLALLASFGAGASVRAAIIYDTLGPEPFTPGLGSHAVIWDYNLGGASGVSTPFSFTGSFYEIASITLNYGLLFNEASPNLEIGIYGDVNGSPSLTPVANLNASPTPTGMRETFTYAFQPGNTLMPDSTYWLVLQPHTFAVPNENYDAAYSISTSGSLPIGVVASRTISYPTSSEWSEWTSFNGPPPVFRLEGTAVPEPGTWALLALGTAAFWCAARRRRK